MIRTLDFTLLNLVKFEYNLYIGGQRMTSRARVGSSSSDSINEVVLRDDVQAPTVLLQVLHELWDDHIVELSLPIRIFSRFIV